MELTLLIMCGVVLLAGKCYSDVNIQQCPYGQKHVAEYRDVSLTCGPCRDLIYWYVDDNSGEDKKYVGECGKTYCYFDKSAAFRLKVNKRNTRSFDSILDILHFTSNNRDNTSFICACYHYFFNTYSNRGGYHLQSRESCKLLIKENKEPPSENTKGGIVGGVVAAVVAIAIIGTIVTVYIVKQRKDVNIQQCPNGQKYVAEYRNVSITCGPCRNLIHWYVDDNSGEETKYVGECVEAACKVKNSAAFGLKVNTRNTQSFDSVLDILHFTNNNADHASFICACYRYFRNTNYGPEGYYLQSMKSCKLLIKERAVPPGSPQLQCPETVFEGSNVSCTCTSANKGSPPAQFVWDGTNTDTLLLQEVGRQLNGMNYTCRQTWGRNGKFNRTIVYTLRVIENKEPPSENMKGGIVGGVVAAVVAIAIIGTIFTVYIVKRRKGRLCKGKINLGLFPCPSNFCNRKKPVSQSFEVVNRSQTPVLHYVAPSGDIYTVASTTTSGDVNGEYVTVREIIENTTTETDMDDNLQTNKELPDKTETRATLKPTTMSKPTTGEPRNFSDLSGTVYMNVTEVPTDSGLGVYHTVPWAVIPATQLHYTGENFEAVLSEEEYNVLFGENSTEQEDQGATYHHLEPNSHPHFERRCKTDNYNI